MNNGHGNISADSIMISYLIILAPIQKMKAMVLAVGCEKMVPILEFDQKEGRI